MFEDLLEKLLLKYLGDYVSLDNHSLHLGIWSGDLQLENLSLNPTALETLQLPLKVNHGFIKSIRLKIPWRSLSNKPVHVHIDGVYILCSSYEPFNDPEIGKNYARKQKQTEIENAMQRKKTTQQTTEEAKGFMAGLVETILNNLQLSISNIHIRYEDVINNVPVTIGAVLGEIHIYTVDKRGERVFIAVSERDSIQKRMDMNGFGLYYDWEGVSYQNPKISTVVKSLEIHADKITKITEKHHFLVFVTTCSVEMSIDLTNSVKKKKCVARVELPEIDVEFHKNQYDGVLRLSDHFLTLLIQQKMSELFRNASQRPEKSIKIATRAWWKYAIECVIAVNTKKKDSSQRVTTLRWENITKFSRARKRYIKLYKRSLEKPWLTPLTEEEKEELLGIEDFLSLPVILLYRSIADEEVAYEEKKRQVETSRRKKEKTAAMSYSSWIWSSLSGKPANSSDNAVADKETTEFELTSAQREELLKTIHIDQILSDAVVPASYVLFEVSYIGNLTMNISDESGGIGRLTGRMESTYQQRHEGSHAHVLLEYIRVESLCSAGAVSGEKLPVLHCGLTDVTLESMPLDGHADSVLLTDCQSCDFRFDMEFIERIVAFVRSSPGKSSDGSVTSQYLSNKAVEWKTKQQAALLEAVANHPVVDMRITVGHPKLTVPVQENGEITARMSAFMVRSILPSAKSTDSMNFSREEYADVAYAYDSLQMKLCDCEVIYSEHTTKCEIVQPVEIALEMSTWLSKEWESNLENRTRRPPPLVLLSVRITDVKFLVMRRVLESIYRLQNDLYASSLFQMQEVGPRSELYIPDDDTVAGEEIASFSVFDIPEQRQLAAEFILGSLSVSVDSGTCVLASRLHSLTCSVAKDVDALDVNTELTGFGVFLEKSDAVVDLVTSSVSSMKEGEDRLLKVVFLQKTTEETSELRLNVVFNGIEVNFDPQYLTDILAMSAVFENSNVRTVDAVSTVSDDSKDRNTAESLAKTVENPTSSIDFHFSMKRIIVLFTRDDTTIFRFALEDCNGFYTNELVDSSNVQKAQISLEKVEMLHSAQTSDEVFTTLILYCSAMDASSKLLNIDWTNDSDVSTIRLLLESHTFLVTSHMLSDVLLFTTALSEALPSSETTIVSTPSASEASAVLASSAREGVSQLSLSFSINDTRLIIPTESQFTPETPCVIFMFGAQASLEMQGSDSRVTKLYLQDIQGFVSSMTRVKVITLRDSKHKRYFIHPNSFTVIERFQPLQEAIQISFDKVKVTLSYEDLLVLVAISTDFGKVSQANAALSDVKAVEENETVAETAVSVPENPGNAEDAKVSLTFSWNEFQCVLLTNAGNRSIPLLAAYLHNIDVLLQSRKEALTVVLSCVFFMDFYNPRNLELEPVIQHSKLDVAFAQETVAVAPRMELFIDIESTKESHTEKTELIEKSVEFAVSFSLVQSILQVAEQWSKAFDSTHRVEETSPYEFRNITGVALEIRNAVTRGDSLIVSNNEIHTLAELIPSKSESSTSGLSLNIAFPEMEFIPLRNISVSRVGVFTFPLKNTSGTLVAKCTVSCVLENVRKIITVSSHIIFSNQLICPVQFCVSSSRGPKNFVPISFAAPGESASLPLNECENDTLWIRPLQSVDGKLTSMYHWAKSVSISPASPRGEGRKSTASRVDVRNCLQQTDKKGEYGEEFYFHIHTDSDRETLRLNLLSPLLIKNTLPVAVDVRVLRNSKIVTFRDDLQSAGLFTVTETSPFLTEDAKCPLICQFSMNRKEFQSRQFAINTSHPLRTVVMSDALGNALPFVVSIETTELFNGTCYVSLFVSYWILDRTGLSLDLGVKMKNTMSSVKAISTGNSGGADVFADEEIWENQRVTLFRKWSDPFLPADRHSWSDKAGGVKLSREGFKIPQGWEWVSDWSIDESYPGSDDDGWMYAFDFHSEWHSSCGAFDTVRTRRWVRKRRLGNGEIDSGDQIAGRQHVMMLGTATAKHSEVYLRHPSHSWKESEKLSLSTAATTKEIALCSQRGVEYSVNALFTPGVAHFSKTQVVTLFPRYVLINYLDYDVKVHEIKSKERPLRVSTNEKVAMHFHSSNKEHLIRVGVENSYSSFFSVLEEGDFAMRYGSHRDAVLSVRVKSVKGSVLIGFSSYDNAHPPYVIENYSGRSISLQQVSTLDVKLPTYTLETNKSMSYCWDERAQNDVHPKLKIVSGGITCQVALDDIGYLKTHHKGRDVLTLSVYADGSTKILRISDESMRTPELFSSVRKASGAEQLMDIQIRIPRLGLSLIDDTPQEVLYIVLDRISFLLEMSNRERKLHLDVGDVQIDNTVMTGHSRYPVIFFSPTRRDKKTKKHFLQLRTWEVLEYPKVQYFKYLGVLLQEFYIRLDFEFVTTLTTLFDSMFQYKPEQRTDIHSYARAEEYIKEASAEIESLEKSDLQSLDIKESLLESSTGMFYFEVLELYPLKFSVSVFKKSEAETILRPDKVLVHTLELVGNVDNAEIRLTGKKLLRLYANAGTLVKVLLQHYSNQFLGAAVQVLGSAEVLGNPARLVKTLGAGVKEFFQEPVNGFVEGPAEFGIGLAKGTKSLLQHSVYGVGSTVASVTNTVGGAFASLSADDEYLKRRELEQSKKADTVFGGLIKGTTQLGKGMYEGVTGVVTQPVKSAEKGGVGGFFSGVGRGVMGLVVKPVTGLVDGVTSVASGLSGQSNVAVGNVEWVRYPRMIYTIYGVVREYDYPTAHVNWIMHNSMHSARLLSEAYYFHFVTAKKRLYLGLHSSMVCVDMTKEEFPIEFDVKLSGMRLVCSGPVLEVLTRDSKRKIVLDSDAQCKYVYERFCELEDHW